MADTITVSNGLGMDVVLYDSYTSEGDDNYFGTLTPLATAKANSSLVLTPIHTPVSVIIVMDAAGSPVGRYISMFSKKDISISQADLDAVAVAKRFVDAITQAPDSDLAKQFHTVIYDQSGAVQVKAIDAFFKASADYKGCTFQAYMLALTYKARNPGRKSTEPVEKQPYSLAELCRYLGGVWPDGFPDILVTGFKCGTKQGTFFLGGHLTLSDLPFENSGIGERLLELIPLNKVEVDFFFHYGLDLGIFGIRIVLVADDFHIPTGGSVEVVLRKPTVSLDISPLFKFVVFKVYATIPFDIFGNKFDAKISMVIDNVEAEVGAVVDGDHSSLNFTACEDLHLEEFGVGMGIIFEPPSVAIGLQGKFHFGSGNNVVALDDDTFALVCAFEEEPEGIPVPNPLYLAFRVPKLELSALTALVTGKEVKLGLPASLQDLSLQWAENPMEPVVLPDGSLTEMAFGCSCYLELLTLRFYGSLELNLQGAHGTFAMSPLQWGTLFSLTGDGKGVSLKVDEQGNLIKNNQIVKTKAEKEAIEKAKTKQIVPPGGPVLAISTSASPYFTLSSRASLLGLLNQEVEASIANDGITFFLDYGAGALTRKMKCLLKDFHNLVTDFSYGLDLNVPLPTVGNFYLGSLHVTALCEAGFTISTSLSDIQLQVHGCFEFAGQQVIFGPYSEDVDISGVTALIEAIGRHLVANADKYFAPFCGDAQQWADSVKNSVIAGVDDIARGLRWAFNKSPQDAAAVMKGAGYDIDVVTSAIVGAFGANPTQMAGILSIVFGVPSDSIAAALRNAGFGAEAVAGALSAAFGLPPDQINNILQGVGFTVNQINDAFNALGGAFADLAKQLWGKLDPRNW